MAEPGILFGNDQGILLATTREFLWQYQGFSLDRIQLLRRSLCSHCHPQRDALGMIYRNRMERDAGEAADEQRLKHFFGEENALTEGAA